MIKGIAYKGKIHNLTDTTSSKAIIDLIYPIGSIYISLDPNFDPATTWGGVWEVIKEGIFLEATEDNAKVGTEIEAGAPDIKGGFYASFINGTYSNGAFYGTKAAHTWRGTSNTTQNQVDDVGFAASKSNPIYGKSDTIQPHAIKCKFHRRIG